MPTIIANPLTIDEEDLSPSDEVVQLQVIVKEEDWVGLFDQIEVWRSRSSPSGPFEELTADKWTPARIPKLSSDPPASAVTGASVVIVGEILQLRINEKDDVVITFTGTDPLTLATVASQITAQGLTKVTAYVDEEGQLTVQTTEPGTGAVLRIVGGDAAAILGLPLDEPESLAFGRNVRIGLKRGTESYLFTDVRGSDAYYYKTRFRNHSTQGVSEFSVAFSVGQALGVSAANIIVGQLELIGLDGKPAVGVSVTIHNPFRSGLVESKLVSEGTLEKLTDRNGRVEFQLVRGTRVTVAVSGTSIVRDIVVPTDTSLRTFDLLDGVLSSPDDVFKVQVPKIISAERRSL